MAFLGRHPKVRRTGVEDHPEFLRRTSNADDAVVLSVHVVGQRLRLRKVPSQHLRLHQFRVVLLELFPDGVYLAQGDPENNVIAILSFRASGR